MQERALKPQAAPAATEGGHDPAQPYYSWLLNYCSWLVSNEPLASVPHDSIRVFRTLLTNGQMEPVPTRAPSHLGPWEWFGVRVQQGEHVLGVGGEMLSERSFHVLGHTGKEKNLSGLTKGLFNSKNPKQTVGGWLQGIPWESLRAPVFPTSGLGARSPPTCSFFSYHPFLPVPWTPYGTQAVGWVDVPRGRLMAGKEKASARCSPEQHQGAANCARIRQRRVFI